MKSKYSEEREEKEVSIKKVNRKKDLPPQYKLALNKVSINSRPSGLVRPKDIDIHSVQTHRASEFYKNHFDGLYPAQMLT